ncbi:MAG TPA: hypothetical protein VG055_13430 [Planctomycetaceae bacterium]|nr:hypothetical protein [Planctomycetaceae bacterium]
MFLRDRGPTEVGGFGIAPAVDLLFVEDIRLVQQTCTSISVAFDDASVAEFFDEQIDAGRRPEQFGRIWIHTHPGESAQPSHVDEETFRRAFGPCDWAVMLARWRHWRTAEEAVITPYLSPASPRIEVGEFHSWARPA